MTYLVISDIHDHSSNLERLLHQYSSSVNAIIFAGDGYATLSRQKLTTPLFSVKGNTDSCNIAAETSFRLHEISVFLTHGHQYRVKSELDSLLQHALENKYDLVLFGHTHRPYLFKHRKTVLFNPGSLLDGYFGILKFNNSRDFSLDHGCLN